MTVLILMAFLQTVCGEVRVDSIYLDPPMIEAGNEVDVYVKFHESPVIRDVWSKEEVPTGAVTTSRSMLYKVKLVPASDISREYVTTIEGEKNVGLLFVGETWTTPFKIKINEGAPASNYRMEFQVINVDLDGKEIDVARLHQFDIPVKGIVKFDVKETDELSIGSTGHINLTVSNVGGGNARHVTLELTAPDSLTVLGSGEVNVGNFIGEESKSVQFNVSVDSKATVSAKKATVVITYINESGSKIRVNNTIGVLVRGDPSIEAGLDSADDFVGGKSGKVVVSVTNKGFIDAKFVTVQLVPTEDYTVESADKSYIGNLASDDFETEEFTIKLADRVQSPIPLKVRVEYKKENSDELISNEFSPKLKVLSAEEYAKTNKANGSKTTITSALIMIPALVVAYLLLWFVYKLVNAITTFLNKKIFKRGL
jgi:hypothetical protein